MIKNIRISKKPLFIILTNFNELINHHYFLDHLNTKNKHCDIGVWHIKYKTKLDN